MFLVQLPVEDAARLWPDIAKTLEAFPELWEVTTLEDLRARTLEGEAQVWMLAEQDVGYCMFMTQIVQYPNAKSFQVFFGAGRGLLENWEMVVGTLRKAARDEGCEIIEIVTTRTGLVQLFRGEGFRLKEMVLVERVAPTRLH